MVYDIRACDITVQIVTSCSLKCHCERKYSNHRHKNITFFENKKLKLQHEVFISNLYFMRIWRETS